jgi:hypothetical protein
MPAFETQPMKAKQPAVEAMRLLGKWQRVSAGHVVFGAGCSCGSEGASVRVSDFEQDILGFLQGRHRRSAASIADMLSSMAREKAPVPDALELLEDLERSLDSFEQVHRGRSS